MLVDPAERDSSVGFCRPCSARVVGRTPEFGTETPETVGFLEPAIYGLRAIQHPARTPALRVGKGLAIG